MIFRGKTRNNRWKRWKGEINGSIEFNNVSLLYPETNIMAINKINLKIFAGSTIGIIGNIGSGKTLLDLVVRLYDPVEGIIKIDGIDIKKYSLDQLRSSISYVPQNAFLFSETIESNIGYGLISAIFKDIVEASKKAAVHRNIISF